MFGGGGGNIERFLVGDNELARIGKIRAECGVCGRTDRRRKKKGVECNRILANRERRVS